MNILIYKMSSVGLLFVAVTEYKKNNLVYFGIWFQSMVTWLCYWTYCGSELHVESMWQWKDTHPMAARSQRRSPETKCTLKKHAPGVGGDGSAGLTRGLEFGSSEPT